MSSPSAGRMPALGSGAERSFCARAAATMGVVVVLHATAVGLLGLGAVASTVPLAAGLVATAYLTGVRHSYDWDHIATIDNSTRRFVAQGREPASVGLAFSLGHSSVVIAAGALAVAGATFLSALVQEGTRANTLLGLVGGTVSGLFLLVMGCYNAAASRRSWSLRRRARRGEGASAGDLESQGLISRLLARPLSRVSRPRDMYAVGFLFGLGFDTASTVSLLIVTASAAVAGVSAWTLLSLPFFFAAGMCLCDSLNGFAVLRMYRSAWQEPVRKLGFNAVITGISAFSALFISAITIGGVLHHGLGLRDPLTTRLAAIDLGQAGLLLIATMFGVWGLAAVVWKSGHRLSGRRS
ncbi:HoxN/HupN/NixA family nickel/cobalt transporter [Georgenia sp. SYP-B2076]|uniref:HoxN/HupN/NixA family nickel/cobalt transporter n=1 Tax=Georgenia sp. SYP-B2076 TaxID=2495881 RepID=UPI001F0C58A5|nr:nickel transporter [Georgenia sp. SYP-B2076]